MWKREPFNTPSTPLLTRQPEIGFEKTEALRLLSTGQLRQFRANFDTSRVVERTQDISLCLLCVCVCVCV